MQFNIMPRIYVRQFTLVHIAKCYSPKSWIMPSHFPMSGFRETVYAHRQETIDTTAPLPDGVVVMDAACTGADCWPASLTIPVVPLWTSAWNFHANSSINETYSAFRKVLMCPTKQLDVCPIWSNYPRFVDILLFIIHRLSRVRVWERAGSFSARCAIQTNQDDPSFETFSQHAHASRDRLSDTWLTRYASSAKFPIVFSIVHSSCNLIDAGFSQSWTLLLLLPGRSWTSIRWWSDHVTSTSVNLRFLNISEGIELNLAVACTDFTYKHAN